LEVCLGLLASAVPDPECPRKGLDAEVQRERAWKAFSLQPQLHCKTVVKEKPVDEIK
jgi:hypothetical protein